MKKQYVSPAMTVVRVTVVALTGVSQVEGGAFTKVNEGGDNDVARGREFDIFGED